MPARKPTINDVAARAGVSKSLVSLAIRGSDRVSDESRAAILRAAEELGYRPNAAARSLADRRSHTIGVLLHDLHNPIFAQVLDGVQEVVREHGFRTTLVTGDETSDREAAEIAALLEFQVEGIILISHDLDPERALRVARECPVVTVLRGDISGAGIASVCSADTEGATLATKHLLSLGHTRIAHISGGVSEVARAREVGYRQTMAEAGLAGQEIVLPGDFTEAGGRRAAVRVWEEHPDVTALFVANDLSALGALAATQGSGRSVPQDVSIIGYDGMSLAALGSLTLTTMVQPLEEMGRQAAGQLFAKIDSPRRRAQHVRVTSVLHPRGTTAPPPPSAVRQ